MTLSPSLESSRKRIGRRARIGVVCLAALLAALFAARGQAQQREPAGDLPTPSVAPVGSDNSSSTAGAKPRDGLLPLGRAWESSHYRVRVWLCGDGSPIVSSLLPGLVQSVERECTLIDASGWELLVRLAPNPWNWRCAQDLWNPSRLRGIEAVTELEFDDKLMVVYLQDSGRGIECQTRELDLTTRQWGVMQTRMTSQLEQISTLVSDAIRSAFMPLAKIELVPTDNTIILRARALDTCLETYMDEQLNWVTRQNTGSPVAIRDDDNFLPVLRKTDRSGKLESLEPVEYTFINVDKMEGTKVTGYVHSMARAPLSGRTSKRLQKLALVIRPQPRPTRLRLYAADDKNLPMEGIEIFARKPDSKKEDASDWIGKTDWRGIIDIPPGDEPLRLIYLKRGARAMKKVPIIPGFHQQLATDVVNDEARLFAEGVILGVQTELLDLVVQREIYEQKIVAEIEKDDFESARLDLEAYQKLPTAQKLSSTLGDEETRLISQAKSKKELEFIKSMFNRIKDVLQTKIANSKEAELRQKILAGGSGSE